MQADTLTSEQSQLFKILQAQQFVSVLGCAGSGKTYLACLWAEHLAREGCRVLFLCRNPYLAEKIQRQLSGSGVDVFAFPAFIQDLLRSERMPDVFVPRAPAGWQAPWTQFDSPSKNDLSRALDILQRGAGRYPALIIDEGQDFVADWLDVAESCLEDGEGSHFVIFMDDNPRLALFGPQHRYAAIQTPLVLDRSCRCAGEIDALVRKLHPAAPRPGLLTDEVGTVREWSFSSEDELLHRLQQALLAAEDCSPDLEDVVVISAESVSSRMSRFAGLVFETPRLQSAPPAGRLSWQAAVLRYLQGYGLLESSLSQNRIPTAEDVRRVNRFCAAYTAAHRAALSRQPSYLPQQRLGWTMDAYGELRLRWVGKEALEYNPVDLLNFFSNPDWAASLPAAIKRYRLTPAEEISSFPDYYTVRLADIPSFKGLEAGVVIFILYNYFAENEDQLLASLYLAFSRAKRRLFIISPAGSFDGTSQPVTQ